MKLYKHRAMWMKQENLKYTNVKQSERTDVVQYHFMQTLKIHKLLEQNRKEIESHIRRPTSAYQCGETERAKQGGDEEPQATQCRKIS